MSLKKELPSFAEEMTELGPELGPMNSGSQRTLFLVSE